MEEKNGNKEEKALETSQRSGSSRNRTRDAKAKDRHREKASKPGAVAEKGSDDARVKSKSSSGRSSSGRSDRDRDAKNKEKARRSGDSAVTPGAVATSNKDGSRRERDAKRKAKVHGSGDASATPGAVSTSNEDSIERSRRRKENRNNPRDVSERDQSERNRRLQQKAIAAVSSGTRGNEGTGTNGEVGLEAVAMDPKDAEIENSENQNQPEAQEDKEEKKKCPFSIWKIIAGAVLLLAIVGGVVGYFLSRSSTDTSEADKPSIVYKYPFPTDEECASIADGLRLEGEDGYERRNIEARMNVQVSEQDPEVQVPILQEHIQKFLMPILAGCVSDPANGNLASAGAGDGRRLQDGDPRNVIANGLVTVKTKEGQGGICDERRSQPSCYVVVVFFDLSVLGDESIVLIIRQVFQDVGNKLKDLLELDQQFVGVTVTSIVSPDPTLIPSASPSILTSSSSSLNPSSTSTSGSDPPVPSFSPTPRVDGPTSQAPVSVPTNTPSVAPIITTTTSPSTSPTFSPTVTASVAPTTAPIVGPSPPPTKFPTKSPTLSPSGTPSHVPSARPSSRPTVQPSNGPSTAATPQPTIAASRSPSKSPSAMPSLRPSMAPSLPEWVFTIDLENSGSPFASFVHNTGNTVVISMINDYGVVRSQNFAGVQLPGTSMAAYASDVTMVRVSIDGEDGMFIDHATLLKDGVLVKQWGTDEAVNGFCFSTDPTDSFLHRDGTGWAPGQTSNCEASHDFVVDEPLWEFQINLYNPGTTYHSTGNTVDISMINDYGVVKSTTYAGIQAPGTTISANAPDVTMIRVSINGDDAMFIDFATLSKDGVVQKQWGTDDGVDGFCFSTDPTDSFLKPDGTGFGLQASNCEASHDFVVDEPLWMFQIFLSHPSACCEETPNNVVMSLINNYGVVKSTTFAGIQLPGTSISANAPDVTIIRLSIDGNDAMFIDYAVLYKDETSVKQWGTDNGNNGYCLCTDPKGFTLPSSLIIMCYPTLDFTN